MFLSSAWLNFMKVMLETQQMIWLRTFRLSLGGAEAQSEASPMVSEKITAADAAVRAVAVGTSADKVAKGYRRKVRANLKKLSGGSRKARRR